MGVAIAGESLLGDRDEQQDYYLYRTDDDYSMAVVCDGMGGMEGGAAASKLAATTFKEDIKSAMPIADISDFLKTEAHRLDESVFQITDAKGNWVGAGTTIVSVLIFGHEMYFMTVGDSRIFICRGDEMIPLNREHNYRLQLDAMRAENSISQNAYEAEQAQGDALISYLGMGNMSILDVNQNPFLLEDGDVLLLCSDGITKVFSKEEIKQILTENHTPKEAVFTFRKRLEEMVDCTKDNTTYVVMKYLEEEGK